MINELESATSTISPIADQTTTPTSDNAMMNSWRGALLETAAADEDATIDLFSSTFNVRSESRTDISRM